MSKELEALKRVKYNISKEVVDAFDSIENALERLEAIDNANPSEALETLKDALIGNGINDTINDYVDNLILPIKQALLKAQENEKVLSIIKEKCVDVGYVIMLFMYKDYNSKMDELWGDKAPLYYLTKEEFKLLKEAFLK